MELSRHEFDNLRAYIHKLCGLNIQADKQYLILQRLEPLLKEFNCDSFAALHKLLTEQPTPELHQKTIAAITTNETSFFRDGHPFDAFKNQLLPKLGEEIKERKRNTKSGAPPKIRIWSAAASTGQEAYSLAILIREFAHSHQYLGISQDDFSILATDISAEALTRATAGKYNEIDMGRGLTPQQKQKYFIQGDRCWIINDDIRKMVEFRKMNLADRFGLMTTFDCIFCRNVLIYFDESTKRAIADRFYSTLSDFGTLILGSAENLYNVSDKFESTMLGDTIVYKKIILEK